MMRVWMWAILALLALAPLPAFAQDVYSPPPPTTYYPQPPIYSPPPSVSYFPQPLIYSTPPTVSYYAGPAPVVSYAAPTTVYYPSGPYLTTYRYGLFGLRTATTSSYYPPVVAPVYPVVRPRVAYYVYP
jgi:hypothetical protein